MRSKESRNMFDKIMTENIPSLKKKRDIQVHKVQKTKKDGHG